MESTAPATATRPTLTTLPGDDIRQILWGFADRFDLQMLVQSVRPVARGPVARLVANGGRHSHEWTAEKNALLAAFDAAGVTGVFAEPEYGGFVEGPKNLALALTAFELAWVDGGAATCSLAGHLALAPIHEKGTEEQKRVYISRAIPQAGLRRRAGPSVSPSPCRSWASIPGCSPVASASRSGTARASLSSRWRSAAASSRTWASRTS